MKILHVTAWTMEHGGIRSYINEITDFLSNKDIQLETMYFNMHENISTEARLHKNNMAFSYRHVAALLQSKLRDSKNFFLHPVEFFRYAFELSAAYIGVEKFDLIHCHDPIVACCITRILSHPVPLITTFHGSLLQESYQIAREKQPDLTIKQYLQSLDGKYLNAIEQRCLSQSNFIITTSHWMRSQLEHNQTFAHKFRTISGGINIHTYDTQQAIEFDGSVPPGKKVIAFTGRLELVKSLHILIDALALLQTIATDWICWIAGEGPMLQQLIQQTINLGIQQHVVFWRHIDNIPSFLKKVHLYVQPSMKDNQPFSVIEAQLAGIPVIVSNTTGLVEMVIPNETGCLFDWPDAQSLANQLYDLLVNETKRNAIGDQARKWAVKERSIQNIGQKLYELYEQALERHQS